MSTKITLKKLAQRAFAQSDIRSVLTSICDEIDVRIECAFCERYNEAVYELPAIARLPGIDADDSKLLIYSELIRIYAVEREFGDDNVKIMKKNGKIYLIIKWKFFLTEEDKYMRRELIREHTLGE